jgi:hypothetical protein
LIVNKITPLVTVSYIEDLGVNNTVETNSSIQTSSLVTDFGIADNLAPADLSTWVSTGMSVIPVIAGQTFLCTNTAASVGSIQYTIIGTFTDIYISLTSGAQQIQGRVKVSIDQGSGFIDLGSVSQDTVKRRGYLVAKGAMTDPIIKIEMVTANAGVGSFVDYIRVAEGRVPN